MPASLESILGYIPLTRAIQTVQSGIPKVLPEKFYTPSPGARVLGDKARNISYKGTRQVARVVPYGSPPRQIVHMPRSSTDVRLLHASEVMVIEHELLMVLRQLEEHAAQDRARAEIVYQAQAAGQRFDNLRVAAIHSMLAFGKIWLDVNGQLLNSASGADLVIDYGIPSTNTGGINPGSGNLIDASWATASTNIVTHVNRIKKYAIQKTGFPLKYAFYGVNVPGYLANNDQFKYYLARNPGMNQRFIDTGRIDGEYIELTWIPVYNGFYEDASGSILEPFPADQVVFTPEITDDIYQLYEGSYPVPKSIQIAASIEAQLDNVVNIYGRAGWSEMTSRLALSQIYVDTFLPRLMNPDTIFLADTTP